MMSQDNRLLPLSSESLDRPLRDLAGPPVGANVPAVAVATAEPAHLREYLAVVLKRKWLILSLMVVVTSLVAIQMYRLPSVYEAATQIQIEQRPRNVLSTARSGDLVIRANDPNYWNTQLAKLRTQQLARQVITRLDLQNNPAFLGGTRGTGIIAGLRRVITREKAKEAAAPKSDAAVPVLNEVELSSDQVTPELAQKLEPFEDTLRENLVIEPVDRTNLVNIRFTHTDPQIAANVVNTLADVFRENDIRQETSGSQKAEDILANQIIDLQARIKTNEERRINYRKSNDLPLGEKQGQDLTAAQLNTYLGQMQAAEAEAERKQAQADYEAAVKTQNTDGIWSIPQVQADKNVQRLRDKISELNEKRKALRVIYTDEWPEVKKIDEQLVQLNEEMKRAPAEIIAGLKNRYQSALQKERSLTASYSGARGKANIQSIAETSLGDLNQAIETDRQNLNLYMQAATSRPSRRRARPASPSGRPARATSSSPSCSP
jgi:polysaccharide biosynthesis transport protein